MKIKKLFWMFVMFVAVLITVKASIAAPYTGVSVVDSFDRAALGNNWSALQGSAGSILDNKIFQIVDCGAGCDNIYIYNQTPVMNGTKKVDFGIVFYNISKVGERMRFGLINKTNLASSGYVFSINQLVNGSSDVLGSFTFQNLLNYTVRMEYKNSNFSFRAWKSDETEPTEWNITVGQNLPAYDLWFMYGYNDGAGTAMFLEQIENGTNPLDDTRINITNIQPNNNIFTNFDISINASANLSYIANCTLKIDSGAVEVKEITNGTNVFINYTTSTITAAGQHNFQITCAGRNSTKTTALQEFYIAEMDNCSTYSTVATEFDLEYQVNQSDINGTMNGFFKIWLENDQVFRPFNLTWNGDRSNYSVCIFPTWANYSLYGQLEYETSVAGYIGGTHYFANTSLDNVTDFVKLYYQNGTTQVTFNVLDENDDPQSEVLIKVLAYDLPTDSFQQVDILQTDDEGKAVGNIILSTQMYKFILERDGILLFESDPTIITLTTKTFRITLGTNAFDDYTTAKDVTGDVSFTNATTTFSFVYSDATNTVTRACLRVTRRSMNGDTIISDACINSATGTINYAITEDVWTNSYIAVGYIIIEDINYPIDTEDVAFDFRYKTYGLNGVFAAFLLILTLVMIGVSSQNPSIAVALLTIGVVGSVLMTIFFLSWTSLVILVIAGGIVLYKLSR